MSNLNYIDYRFYYITLNSTSYVCIFKASYFPAKAKVTLVGELAFVLCMTF